MRQIAQPLRCMALADSIINIRVHAPLHKMAGDHNIFDAWMHTRPVTCFVSFSSDCALFDTDGPPPEPCSEKLQGPKPRVLDVRAKIS